MKLSTRCRYGTRAMIEIAHRCKNGPAKRKDIATTQKISSYYLENILITLKSHKLIRTIRGAHGGFTLEKSPEQITMFEIVTALEGSVAPVHCIDDAKSCNRATACPARKFWEKLQNVQVKLLKSTTLQSLLDSERSAPDYSI